MTAYHFC